MSLGERSFPTPARVYHRKHPIVFVLEAMAEVILPDVLLNLLDGPQLAVLPFVATQLAFVVKGQREYIHQAVGRFVIQNIFEVELEIVHGYVGQHLLHQPLDALLQRFAIEQEAFDGQVCSTLLETTVGARTEVEHAVQRDGHTYKGYHVFLLLAQGIGSQRLACHMAFGIDDGYKDRPFHQAVEVADAHLVEQYAEDEHGRRRHVMKHETRLALKEGSA